MKSKLYVKGENLLEKSNKRLVLENENFGGVQPYEIDRVYLYIEYANKYFVFGDKDVKFFLLEGEKMVIAKENGECILYWYDKNGKLKIKGKLS
ncbi:MAG: hypothetical protein QXR05_07120 [Candidatus Methanomethylicia archaeon]